ncbi:MAG: DEAD/DEAH box helicase [Anaerolineales bacterium]|nr:DEAD/DEAH box helicase [Anaerolineales bacterium]
MRGEIVALDLETTGLDYENDTIIEIGAVRYRDGEIVDEFSTLIDPGIPIPTRITMLTGITDDDVTGAPRIREVIRELKDFLGNDPIVGHKISTDMTFLQKYISGLINELIDTYELSAVLLPDVPRYNLNSLTETLGIEGLENAHRALDDAIAAGNLYWVLWQKILELPLPILHEIVTASQDFDWDAKLPLIEALNMRVKTAMNDGENLRMKLPFKGSERREWDSLRPNDHTLPLDVKKVAALIEPNGQLAQEIPSYESRKPQVDMLKAVTDAFNYSQHTMVEAPTGTGKSIAYLIPAILWATTNNRRVVVSTATIALQDQLMDKDIPLLQQTLGVPFTAAVAKGRANYLCPRQLEAMRRRGPNAEDELRVLAKVLVWLHSSQSGDRAEITLRGIGEEMAWLRLSAQDEGCTLTRCEKQMGGSCPFFKARRKAETAHILVANHSLLLSDVQLDNRVLPNYRYVVIDEAHHLEEATTNGLSYRLDRNGLKRRFADMGDMQRGLFGELLTALKGAIPAKYYEQLEPYIQNVSSAVKDMGHHIDAYFKALTDFLEQTGEIQQTDYLAQIRIVQTMRLKPQWKSPRETWGNLKDFLTVISKALDKLASALIDFSGLDIPDYDDHLNSVQSAARYLQDVYQQLEAFTTDPEENMIYWCEVNINNLYLTVNGAPLHVGPLIQEHIWEPKEAVVLTSATLTTAKSFGFIRSRLNAFDEIADYTVDTPFDYKSSTLIYIPTDIPEPNNREIYQTMVERGIIELATALDGRLLGLFTSYSQLRETANAIAPRLALGGIHVLDQTSGSSRQLLIESFKSTEKAVLLGTRSFWEGVDIPGEDLQAVAIARLPFAVPSDPIFAARSETFENSFLEYAVPDAVLRFRQGFGRLIRRKTDRGVVAIFDKRIISKRYGKAFLDSLPPCTIQQGPLARLGQATQEWMGR